MKKEKVTKNLSKKEKNTQIVQTEEGQKKKYIFSSAPKNIKKHLIILF